MKKNRNLFTTLPIWGFYPKTGCQVFFILFASLLTPLSAQNPQSRFKPGDWFECEMEFENFEPVFRNHWFNKDSMPNNNNFFSVRFTYIEGDSTGYEKWEYKILRYKALIFNHIKTKTFQKNVYCFDTWYPEYFTENFDSVRNSLHGFISINSDKELKHEFQYKTDGYFNLFNFIPMKLDKEKFPKEYVSVSISYGNELAMYLETIAGIIFQCENVRTVCNIEWGKRDRDQIEFTSQRIMNIHNSAKNEMKAWLLENGLPYAFSDKHDYKVFSIYNASFPLPNMAVLKIIDHRTKEDLSEQLYPNLFRIDFNSAGVIDNLIRVGSFKLEGEKTEKTFNLKYGSVFQLIGIKDKITFYLEPGDTLIFELNDNNNKLFGNSNNTWWQNNRFFNANDLNNDSLTNEFKDYLNLYLQTDKLYMQVYTLPLDSFYTSVIDFFTLKTYHYGYYLQKYGFLNVIHNYLERKSRLIENSGQSIKSGFLYDYYKSIPSNSNFLTYYDIQHILQSEEAILEIGKNMNLYELFLKNCGDPLLKKFIINLIDDYKSVQPGKILPFKTLMNEKDEKIDILPSKGKLGLIFIHLNERHSNYFINLVDSLSDDLETVSYNCSDNDLYSFSGNINRSTIKEEKYTNIVGSTAETKNFRNYNNNLILYNDKGEILLYEIFDPTNFSENIKRIQLEINDIVDKYNQKYNSNIKKIIYLIVICLICFGAILFLFFKLRLGIIKKRNQQQQLIQELKLKSVQSQLNPHFIFNALNSIQVLVKNGDSNKADQYLVGFSELLRTVLKNADKRLVSLSDELQIIKRYCELEKLRMNFECNLEINTKTNIDLLEVPYMLLQPVVENAIKHGVSKSGEKGLLHIGISEEGNVLLMEVTDNGPGLGGLPLEILKENGRGLKLSLEKLQSIYGDDADFVILDGNPGTRISITLKIG